uniref:Spc7 domain-containing protein n=1 Tax=Strongyloides venezuelensis TaxID=75913 RepID=A0A0K0FIB4_STRVS
MHFFSPITEESTPNTSSSLRKSKKKKERVSVSEKATEVTKELVKIAKIIEDKTTPKRSLHYNRKHKNGLECNISPKDIINSPLKKDENEDNTLIIAAIELDEDNYILSPNKGIITDFSELEKFKSYKNDRNARFFSYDDIKKIDNSFEVPPSSVNVNSPKIYTNSTCTIGSTAEEFDDALNVTMIEDASEAVDNASNESKTTEEKKKVTFSEELVKIDDVMERDEVSQVHDYHYYSDDEQTIFHTDIDDEESLNDISETAVTLSDISNDDLKEVMDNLLEQVSADTYKPLDLSENNHDLNSSMTSTITINKINTTLSPIKEVSFQRFSLININNNYVDLKNEVSEIKKNQEKMLEIMININIQNEKIIEKATKNHEEIINNLKNKISDLETELELSDKEIIECCNRATLYRRIYLELAVEGNKVAVEDAAGQMNDPLYNEEYFQKFKKISDYEFKTNLSSIDMTNRRITIERLDKTSSNNSVLKRINSILSPRKSNI